MRVEKSDKVRPKKFLGQHFLHDQSIAKKIVDGLQLAEGSNEVLEIGPGMGVLTKFLAEANDVDLKLIEIDRESVVYLKQHYPLLRERIIEGDFLKLDLTTVFGGHFSVIGNFPYNISSQIFFRVLDHRHQVDQVVCMLQKEVADRIAAKHGNKTYGILSVLLQAYYHIDMLFKVSPGVFTPPPKVMSAVIRLRRNNVQSLPCDEILFVQVVKQGFNNRRKTLRNALKNLNLATVVTSLPLLDKRAEQLSVDDFIFLTQKIEDSRGAIG
ncbi:16S rRNA (adenine(1518)-N(6)/adenine(1519)-N(6))-dimethyltransferase RsmA [Pseudochryseolinea flava]|uniref:Ribosomal RNA small subunit methyltransferase A n=1 Tax=Pseudochryseolinea flava TaxID=2059302 RepID=A0A364Y402_9BACT|nr:16S rRNA (adenine(1518)-N(6)/adenine(1519)-N(6))-dimethyltransferase RsmA [Pseudochryseolinea flava]RAW01680.1 16S rRNA (adenine(1518)-N(6)/adenine(1519)-N(6))-dimethyltransferase [Pseudochryseolinea flava]